MEDVAASAEKRTATQHTDAQKWDKTETLKPQDKCSSGPSWRPKSLGCSSLCSHTHPHPPCSQGPAVLALQSKVKALKQNKAFWTQPSKNNQDKMLVSSTYIWGRPPTGPCGSGSSDETVKTHSALSLHIEREAQAQLPHHGEYDPATIATMFTIPQGFEEGATLENFNLYDWNNKQDVSFTPTSKHPWVPPKGFWKICRPDSLQLKEGIELGAPATGLESTPLKSGTSTRGDLQTNSLDSHFHSYVHNENRTTLAVGYRLCGDESLESFCPSGSAISLAERVELNRCILRQMLQKAHSKNCEEIKAMEEMTKKTNIKAELNDSEGDSGIFLHDSETQSAFVSADDLPLSPRHEHAKRLLERARMKARSCPLKADHNILPIQRDKPELLSWVRAPLVGKEGVTLETEGVPLEREGVVSGVASGNLSDSSSSDSTGGPRRRRGQSPTRVRFEDESEKDAEVRYLERLRQRRRAGERAQGLLAPKPSLDSYVNGCVELGRRPENSTLFKHKSRKIQEDSLSANSLYKPLQHEAQGRLCNSCGTLLDATSANSLSLAEESRTVPCWVAPTLPNRLVRIEQIKETYIGTICPITVGRDGTQCTGADGTGSTSSRETFKKQNKKSKKGEFGHEALHGCKTPDSLAAARPSPKGTDIRSNSPIVLPPNPYDPDFQASTPPPKHPQEARISSPLQYVLPLLQSRKSVVKSALKDRPTSQYTVTPTPSSQCHPVPIDPAEEGLSPEQWSSTGLQHRELSCGQEHLTTPRPSHGFRNAVLKQPSSSKQHNHANKSPALTTSYPADVEHSQITAELPAISAEHPDHQTKELQQEREDSPSPSHSAASSGEGRDVGPLMTLRRFFSAVGLNGVGGRLAMSRSGSMEQLSLSKISRTTSGGTGPGQLKKAPSLQSLRLGSPFLQLKKSASMQSLQSPKRKPDRSSAYRPGEQHCSPAQSRELQRTLSVEDVGGPSAVRSVGRVVQAFPDGTLLLELTRPPDGLFGFLISRGKGRADSGVYVEEMGDSSTQKLYAGLLRVGDEIVEVNGEKVAGLSLELVTHLMTQNITTSLRVLRHRQTHY